MGITNAQYALCALVGKKLFGADCEIKPNTDWAEVFAESRAQAVTLAAFGDYKTLALDDELQNKVKSAVSRRTLMNIQVFRNHMYLHKLMSQNRISYCVLKGTASAQYYPEPLIRNMGDVDFYVAPNDFERAVEILLKDGFSSGDLNSAHHLVFRKEKMHFEMHREAAGIPDGGKGEIIRDYLSDLVNDAALTFNEFVSYIAPSAFHHGLIMLLHMQHHMVSEGIGLRHLCDWAVFANSLNETEFTNLFEQKLRNAGLWKFAKTISLAAAIYLGMPKKAWMGDDCELAAAIIEDIFVGGNFGAKDGTRRYEGMLISNRGKNGMSKNRLLQGFSSLNRVIRAHWPIAAKLPVIYPFGWVFFSVRYVILALLGKRTAMRIFDTYQNSGKRKQLYSRLRLFETEDK